jgi:alpha-ketoglutarate-dependent taurine dioxygenase
MISSTLLTHLLSVDVFLLIVFAFTCNVTLRGALSPQHSASRTALQRVNDAGWRATLLQPFGIELRCDRGVNELCEFASLDVATLRSLAWLHGHVVLEQVRTMNQSELETHASQFGPLLRWKFGFTFHVRPERDFKSTVNSRGKTPIHFDGMFYSHVPSFQLFQCVLVPDNGGETTFIHTVPLVAAMSPELRARARRTTVNYFTPHLDYFGGATSSFPLVRAHPFLQGAEVLLWHEPHAGNVIQPVNRTVVGSDDSDVLAQIDEIAMDERFVRYHRWGPNQLVLADNIGQLHGRRPFGEETERLLWRIHIM